MCTLLLDEVLLLLLEALVGSSNAKIFVNDAVFTTITDVPQQRKTCSFSTNECRLVEEKPCSRIVPARTTKININPPLTKVRTGTLSKAQ